MCESTKGVKPMRDYFKICSAGAIEVVVSFDEMSMRAK